MILGKSLEVSIIEPLHCEGISRLLNQIIHTPAAAVRKK